MFSLPGRVLRDPRVGPRPAVRGVVRAGRDVQVGPEGEQRRDRDEVHRPVRALQAVQVVPGKAEGVEGLYARGYLHIKRYAWLSGPEFIYIEREVRESWVWGQIGL